VPRRGKRESRRKNSYSSIPTLTSSHTQSELISLPGPPYPIPLDGAYQSIESSIDMTDCEDVGYIKSIPGIRNPERSTTLSAGLDFFPPSKIRIKKGSIEVINTGICFQMSKKVFGLIFLRSSWAKLGLIPLGQVIDSDFRQPIKVCIYNSSNQTVTIPVDVKFAQIVFFTAHSNSNGFRWKYWHWQNEPEKVLVPLKRNHSLHTNTMVTEL